MQSFAVNKETITEQVFRYLRQLILSNQLASGERLIETKLAGELSVSRTPVREAIRMLEAEGLVQRRAHGHSLVAQRSLEDMVDAFQVRIALETYATRLATQRVNPAQLSALEKICEESELKFEGLDGLRLNELGDDFHAAIIDIAGNPRLKKRIEAINHYIQVYRSRLYRAPKIMEYDGVSHREIFDAVRAGRADRAQELMRQHLTVALELLKSLWQAD